MGVGIGGVHSDQSASCFPAEGLLLTHNIRKTAAPALGSPVVARSAKLGTTVLISCERAYGGGSTCG